MDDILLVASDLDRTLLLEGGKMPRDLRDYVQRLNEQGIVFVPASGRPLATLKEMFDWPDMDLAFISDNGAVVESGGKILHQSVISPEQYLSMVEGTLTSTDGYPTLCGMNAAYLPVAARPLADQFRVYYKNLVFVTDFDGIEEEIVKYSAYFPHEDARGALDTYFQPTFGDSFTVTLGGPPWVDIMNTGVSKGSAIGVLSDHLGLGRHHLMAFGDTLNDLEMLAAVEHSYAVANADQEIKDQAQFLTASNEELGVYQVLDRLLDSRRD